jgi:hypothetical protein
MRLLLALAALALLTGCATFETPEQIAAKDDASCAGYGFKPGTDAFAQCRLQLGAEHAADSRAQRANAARISAALLGNRPQTCSAMSTGSSWGGFYSGNTTATCY